MNTLSEYKYFHILKSITSYIFYACFENRRKPFSLSLKETNMILTLHIHLVQTFVEQVPSNTHFFLIPFDNRIN